jgi:hypothetical protein
MKTVLYFVKLTKVLYYPLKKEDKLSEIVNDLQTKWIKADSRKDQKLMDELESKIEVARAEWLRYRNNKKSNVGREKR